MKLNLEDILKYVLPMVQDDKKDDAKKVIKDTLQPESPSLVQSLLGLFGGKEKFDLAALLPKLLGMIKPENVKDIQGYFAKLTKGGKK